MILPEPGSPASLVFVEMNLRDIKRILVQRLNDGLSPEIKQWMPHGVNPNHYDVAIYHDERSVRFYLSFKDKE